MNGSKVSSEVQCSHMKISVSKKNIEDTPKKYVRLVVTKDAKNWHRLVETADGTLEYRMGAGKWEDMTPRKFITFVRSIVQAAKSHQIEHLAIQLSKSWFPKLEEAYGETWVVSTIVENIELAAYEFKKYKTSTSHKKKLEEVLLCGGLNKKAQVGFDRGLIVGAYVNKARDIANTPGDDMSPGALADAAKELAKGTKVQVKVLEPKQIQKELPALWAVGKGADDLPRFIVMEYYGAGKPAKTEKKKEKQPIVLVGKGITYDTGGLNVKPSGFMHDMHMDMSGGSSVMAAIACAAKLGVKKNIIAIIPAAENAVSEKSMRAGDIINSHAGKTIEVLHTDAEGRLVLADGLSYAKQYNPRVILDTATLTGAALVALGQHASAILTEDNELAATLMEYGEETGDYVWPLPLWDEYKAPLTKTRADVVNIMPNFSKFAGTIEGAAFLSFFAPKNVPWCHIDIAPRMNASPTDKLTKGSTGEPVRLLVKFIESY